MFFDNDVDFKVEFKVKPHFRLFPIIEIWKLNQNIKDDSTMTVLNSKP